MQDSWLLFGRGEEIYFLSKGLERLWGPHTFFSAGTGDHTPSLQQAPGPTRLLFSRHRGPLTFSSAGTGAHSPSLQQAPGPTHLHLLSRLRMNSVTSSLPYTFMERMRTAFVGLYFIKDYKFYFKRHLLTYNFRHMTYCEYAQRT